MSNLEMLNSPEFRMFVDKTVLGDEASYHFFDMMPIGISITTDISCKEIRHNPKAASFLRIDDWSILSHSAADITDLKILSEGRELSSREMPVQRAAWLGEEIDSEELEFVWEDGVRKIGLWSARPVRDDNGVIVGSLAVCEDITERKLLEEERLKETRDHFQNCLESMLDCFAIFNVERGVAGQIIGFICEYINDSGCKNYNMTPKDYIGRGIHEIFPGCVENGLFETYCQVVETGKPLEIDSFYISNKKTSSISEVEVYDIKIIKLDESIAVFWRNITEKKKLEDEIGRLARLNIVGELAASIGHEIRNPLTTVRGYLQMLGKKEKLAEYKEQFEVMIEELDRANFIVTEFLSLAKNKTINFERNNLNDNIKALLPLMQADALRSGHEIKLELGSIPDLDLDKKQIRQLLLNLVRNGQEAMPSNGTIVIKTGVHDGRVFLAVRDSGYGIRKDILDKLGTPFITTKENGTGLGLPVCYRIAERHNAKIDIQTGLDGTTFFVKFNGPAN